MAKLTKKIMQEYGIEIDKFVLDSVCFSKPRNLYYITSEPLKINWSGEGSNWLSKAKKDLLDIIENSTNKYEDDFGKLYFYRNILLK